jgi:hypothetical protein
MAYAWVRYVMWVMTSSIRFPIDCVGGLSGVCQAGDSLSLVDGHEIRFQLRKVSMLLSKVVVELVRKKLKFEWLDSFS